MLERILKSTNLKEASLNSVLAFISAELADVAENSYARLNHLSAASTELYNMFTTIHIAMGTFASSYTHRRFGFGAKGFAVSFTALTLLNVFWETYEGKVGLSSGTLDLDTTFDVAMVYAGGLFGAILEKLKQKFVA